MPRRSPIASKYVYFVQAKTLGLIKIGVATEPHDRLYTLRISSPDELTLLGVIRDDAAFGHEHGLHRRFAEHNSHGEWFRPAPAILAYIEQHAVDYDELLSAENLPLVNAAVAA